MKTFKQFVESTHLPGLDKKYDNRYGSAEYQNALKRGKEQKEKQKRQQQKQHSDKLHHERVHGKGIKSYEKHPETGKVVSGWRKDGKFTPD